MSLPTTRQPKLTWRWHKTASSSGRKLPPLWLSASALTAAITATDGLIRRVIYFVAEPYDNDFRLNYVAAKIGLTYGWSHIYDRDLQRRVMASVTPYTTGRIDSQHQYVTPPPMAWLHVPFTLLSVPSGFVLWVVLITACLVLAWWLACPRAGLGGLTLLLIAFALWPVYYALLIGQTTTLSLVCIAASWKFLERERWAPAGAALTGAIFIKPQLVILLPVALLVSGRWRPVAYAGAFATLLAAMSVVAIGAHGVSAFADNVRYGASNVLNGIVTYAWFGPRPVATSIEIALGIVAMSLAWYRRDRLDLVFALGIVGTTASAFYLHEYDVAIFLVPAWILLRTPLSLPMRAWLVAGIGCAQLIGIGIIRPILVWEVGWICLLGLEPWLLSRMPTLNLARDTRPTLDAALRQ